MDSNLLMILFILWFIAMWLQATPRPINGVAGITEIDIQCSGQFEGDMNSVFWIINGSVYGPLQVPAGFIVCNDRACNLNTLTIPEVWIELDGYIIQCVSINYDGSTLHLRRTVDITVITLQGLNGTRGD